MAKTAQRYRAELVRTLTKKNVVRTESVRAALLAIPREAFIPEIAEQRGIRAVYSDEAVPTKTDAAGMPLSSCSQPSIVAAMLEVLHVKPGNRILEIGAGTGYNAALLAHLTGRRGRVASMEVDAETARRARGALRAVGRQVRVVFGDGSDGWAHGAPYDRIIATASADHVPRLWFEQLEEEGLLVMPLRLTDSLPFRQVVIALRKAEDHLESAVVIPGGFMRMREPDDEVSLPWPEMKATLKQGNRKAEIVTLSGQSLANLGAGPSRRLLATVLSKPRRVPLGIRVKKAEQYSLEVFIALAAPPNRLVGFVGPDSEKLLRFSTSLPAIMERNGANVAVLGGRSVVGYVDEYGSGEAVKVLRKLVDEWNDLQRPGVDRLRVTVRFDAIRRRSWRTINRGDSVVTLNWASSD